jgi:hypothetical protein
MRFTNLLLYRFTVLLACCGLFSSCEVIKNAPKNKPFVLENKLVLQTDIRKDDKKVLENTLNGYWDDSIKVKSISEFSFKLKKFGYHKNFIVPYNFDTAAISRSKLLMNSYLNSQGYYNATLKHAVDTIRKAKYQKKNLVPLRVTINIDMGKNLKVDSFSIQLVDTINNGPGALALQHIAMTNFNDAIIKKNMPYSKQLISLELDRLVALFRKNGYFKITREILYAEVDTLDPALLEITLDPFEQARKIDEVTERRKNNPTINIIVKQRAINDSLKLRKYFTGNTYFYPETRTYDNPDSLLTARFDQVFTRRQYTIKSNNGMFHLTPLVDHSFLRKDSIYNEEAYYKTINGLTQLGSFRQIDVRLTERMQGDSAYVDYHFFLMPEKKYSFTSDLEGSRNTGNIVTAGNLLGVSAVLNFRDKNVWKEAIQSSTTFRNGVELSLDKSNSLLQTIESSFSHTYSFPKFVTPFKLKRIKRLDATKTSFSINASYTDRRDFFRLRSLVASWGYEWRKGSHNWNYRPLNVELYSLDTLPRLIEEFIKKPFLRNAFNTGYVVSQSIGFSKTFKSSKHPTHTNFIRLSVEEAGSIFGRFKGLRDKIYQYVKAEVEYKKLIQLPRNQIAIRTFGGIGINYSDDDKLGTTLPFFKQFVAGGPNSMRAWGLRQLGLGKSLVSDTATSYRDRFGDMQLEANIEYRFRLTTLSSFKFDGALFTDIGNIWNVRQQANNPGSEFLLKRFLDDIAIGVGSGIRMDFSYFLIRFDFAYKVKDPTRSTNGGWMSIKDFTWKNKEFSSKDPNTGRELIRRNNFAFQFGIGLPF